MRHVFCIRSCVMTPPTLPTDPNKGLKTAATAALWIWVSLAGGGCLLMILLVGGCTVFFGSAAVVGIQEAEKAHKNRVPSHHRTP